MNEKETSEEVEKIVSDLMSKLGISDEDDYSRSMSMQDMIEQKSADQEILTFNFLKDFIVRNTGDDAWPNATLEEYHQNSSLKVTASLMALNFLTSAAKDSLLQNKIWSAPYGFFYMWQFAINGFQYMEEDSLEFAAGCLEPLAEDLNNNLDYGRFNHMGRIIAALKLNVYCANNNSAAMNKAFEAMGEIRKATINHAKAILPAALNTGLQDLEKEACEMSIRMILECKSKLSSSSRIYYLSSGEKDVEYVIEDIKEMVEFVETLKSEDWTGERSKLFADIEKDFNDMLEHIQPKRRASF